MKSAGKARNNGLYRHIRTSKEIIRNLLNDCVKKKTQFVARLLKGGLMKKSNNKKTRDVTAFIYPRLSRDDNLEGESYSISNQKSC